MFMWREGSENLISLIKCPLTMVVDDRNPEPGVLFSVAIGNGFVDSVED